MPSAVCQGGRSDIDRYPVDSLDRHRDAAPGKIAPRIGLVLQILVMGCLLFDAVSHNLNLQVVNNASVDLVLRDEMAPSTAIVILVVSVLYVISATSTMGAIVLTGCLGGAVLTNWRVEKPLLSVGRSLEQTLVP